MKHLEDFAAAAREFSAWCLSTPSEATLEARVAIRQLARLYSLALALERSEDVNFDLNGQPSSDAVWRQVYERAAALPFNYYSLVEDPLVVPTEAVNVGDLADDIADIHRDLTEGLSLYDAGHSAEAAYTFRFTYQVHWGAHAAEAISALHSWLARDWQLIAGP
jgi:hypothetical protein